MGCEDGDDDDDDTLSGWRKSQLRGQLQQLELRSTAGTDAGKFNSRRTGRHNRTKHCAEFTATAFVVANESTRGNYRMLCSRRHRASERNCPVHCRVVKLAFLLVRSDRACPG